VVAIRAVDAEKNHCPEMVLGGIEHGRNLVGLEHSGTFFVAFLPDAPFAGPLEMGAIANWLLDQFGVVSVFANHAHPLDFIANGGHRPTPPEIGPQLLEVGGGQVGNENRLAEELQEPLTGGVVIVERALVEVTRFDQKLFGGEERIDQVSQGQSLGGDHINATGHEVVFVVDVSLQGGFRVVPSAEVEAPATYFFGPLAVSVGKQGEITIWLNRLACWRGVC